MKVIPLFPTPVFHNEFGVELMTKIEEDIDLESLEYERYPDDTGSGSVDKDVLNRPEFALLKEAIDENMKEFYHRILRAEHGTPVLSGSWINVHEPGDQCPQHIHCNACYSGVFYFDVPIASGSIEFFSDKQVGNHASSTLYPGFMEKNALNTCSYRCFLDAGVLLIFPSHLRHGTEPNNSESKRYSMGFNYFLEGEFGRETGRVTLETK